MTRHSPSEREYPFQWPFRSDPRHTARYAKASAVPAQPLLSLGCIIGISGIYWKLLSKLNWKDGDGFWSVGGSSLERSCYRGRHDPGETTLTGHQHTTDRYLVLLAHRVAGLGGTHYFLVTHQPSRWWSRCYWGICGQGAPPKSLRNHSRGAGGVWEPPKKRRTSNQPMLSFQRSSPEQCVFKNRHLLVPVNSVKQRGDENV